MKVFTCDQFFYEDQARRFEFEIWRFGTPFSCLIRKASLPDDWDRAIFWNIEPLFEVTQFVTREDSVTFSNVKLQVLHVCVLSNDASTSGSESTTSCVRTIETTKNTKPGSIQAYDNYER